MAARVTDPGETIYAFLGETLVRCPRCGSCARSVRLDASSRDMLGPRRLSCGACGLARQWAGRKIIWSWRAGDPHDGYFNLPLWLQAPDPLGVQPPTSNGHREHRSRQAA